MTQYKDIVTAPEAIKGFYPTPPELAAKLLEGIDWGEIEEVLEPSAGTGNLIEAVARVKQASRGDRYTVNVDAVEIDPALRAALAAAFDEDAMEPLKDRIDELEAISRKHYDWEYLVEHEYTRRLEEDYPNGEPPKLAEAQKEELNALKTTKYAMEGVEVRIVGDDFLTFRTGKHYQLIVMNPPFANGDEHLEKAIAMQERFGGKIRCILNAETLRNPYTVRRQMLVKKLNELDAEIEYVDNAFADAERKANVDVALIRVTVPAPELHSDIFDRLTKAEETREHVTEAVSTDLALNDLFERMVAQFNVECQAGIELMRAYTAMTPYIMDDMDTSNKYSSPNIELKVGGHSGCDVNKFIRLTRHKYWRALFQNPEFTGKLTSELYEKWSSKVNELDAYDFSVFNIKKIVVEMNGQLLSGIEETIMQMFSKMTEEHSWYTDAKTIHYFNGWKTNKAHMIGKKIILPAVGAYVRDDIWKSDRFNAWDATRSLSDLEKILDYFDGEGVFTTADMSAIFTVWERTGSVGQRCINCRPPKNIDLKHFKVTFYKKGTVHITFHDQKLVDRFNIYCARKANELPPNYGYKPYSDLDPKEKAVVDSFNGDGTEGSGQACYTAVYENQALYLSEPIQKAQVMALPEMGEV